jgi:beta-glucosidase
VIDHIRVEDKNIPLITVLVAGRPMIINNALNISNAVISAWLPGTSGGQGIVDAITGDYNMRPNGKSDRVNSLSMDWPKDMVFIVLI